MAIDFNVYITDEACSRARNASSVSGWYLTPTRWAISNTSNEAVTQSRTSDSVNTSGIWVTQPFSAVTRFQNKSLLHSIVIPPDASQVSQPIKEIYFFYNDVYGKEFLFAIAEPVDPLTFAPGVSQSYKFLFSLNNNNDGLVDIVSINYTYPQDIEDHNVNVDAHDFLLARDGSRTATGVLRYATQLNFDNDRDLIDKGYLNAELFNYEKYLDNSIPVGSVAWWPTDNPPEFWMERNGAALSRTAYSQLFAVLGTKYGEGDGSTTFNIPYDLEGRFIESQDYYGKTVGTNVNYDLGSVTGGTTVRSRVYLPIIKVRSNTVVSQQGHSTEFIYYRVNDIVAEYKNADNKHSGPFYLDIMMDGYYEIEAVSGGAGGCGIWSFDAWYNGAYGSTGCYYKNTFTIRKGTYMITVGSGGPKDGRTMYSGGDTVFENHLLLKGGQGAGIPGEGAGAVGKGGYLKSSSASDNPETTIYRAGYRGHYYTANYGQWSGGPQKGPQQNYGLGAYGQGGLGSTSANVGAGTGGYMKITYKGTW